MKIIKAANPNFTGKRILRIHGGHKEIMFVEGKSMPVTEEEANTFIEQFGGGYGLENAKGSATDPKPELTSDPAPETENASIPETQKPKPKK
jgi:hypothetical protein